MINHQIGEAMPLSAKNEKHYVSSLLAKLDMQRHTQTAALSAGLHAQHGQHQYPLTGLFVSNPVRKCYLPDQASTTVRIDTESITGDRQHGVISLNHQNDVYSSRPSRLGDIGQRLAQHRHQVVGKPVTDRCTHRTNEVHPRSRPVRG